MSKCVSGFAKVTLPVNYPDKGQNKPGNEDLDALYTQYVSNDKMDVCVKQCNNGSVPINTYSYFNEKFEFNLKNIMSGVEFACYEMPSEEITNIIPENEEDTITKHDIKKCNPGFLVSFSEDNADLRCAYIAPNYILKK
jgi:hypothetical protein